ncbi:MAG TPA: hypothetical protein PLF13_00125 [candidate division Zixibacteria bacterium]|nr:hypothetical protein [candidate division Zixibacteria bacterium]
MFLFDRPHTSGLTRSLVWLIAVWLFVVVVDIDRFHNHNCLEHPTNCCGDHDCCGTTHCTAADGIYCFNEAGEATHGSHGCAACRFWTTLSSSDFVVLAGDPCNDGISALSVAEEIMSPVADLVVCFGRSPPVSI